MKSNIRERAPRAVAAIVIAVLGGGVVGGCTTKDGDVSCTLSVCTVTLDRGVDAKASVLGAEVKLVDVSGGQVTVDVGGNQLVVPTGEGEAQGGGLTVRVDKVTADQVVLKISKA